MGIFDLFKSKSDGKNNNSGVGRSVKDPLDSPEYFADSSTVAEDERPYYQPDTYYTYYSYAGTGMGDKVIPFEDRKRISYPSARGLFVGEIMLLVYCDKGTYPKPKSGYPGLWWFSYGIRDVGSALKSLEERGFIQWASKKGALKGLKVDELKHILSDSGLSTDGKKADLIERIIKEIPEDKIVITDYIRKYELTELGKQEIEDNGYVPYMHGHKHKTREDDTFGETFTVWDINKLFPDGNATSWREVVGKIEKKKFGVNMANAAPVEKKKNTAKQVSTEQRDEMRSYLSSKKDVIQQGISTSGDGYAEESKGLDYQATGRDKEALVQFFISIGKGFDAPALYREAAKLLHRYQMFEEEVEVLNAGLRNVPGTNRHREDLEKRKEKALDIIQKQA